MFKYTSIPDFVAGQSLGEYNALFAAEVVDFETGLRLVQKRGELMSSIQGGGMAAIIGMDEEKIEQIGTGEVLTGLMVQIKREMKKSGAIKTAVKEEGIIEVKAAGIYNETYPYGSKTFQERYGLRYPYVVGSMYKGISSADMVIKTCKSGMLAFYGAGGVRIDEIGNAIIKIQNNLTKGQTFGVNLIHNAEQPEIEDETVDLLLRYKVKVVEASAYIKISPALVRYKIKGLKVDGNGKVISENRVIAKLSRPEVAESFLSPIPQSLIEQLLNDGRISQNEAKLAENIPIADEITVEADSAGHTDHANPCVLWPTILRLCKNLCKKYNYTQKVCIGAAGGIGTPEAIECAFMLGADYIVTGSINQCTVEAGTSDVVKDLLQKINIQDTEYAPAGDMFELGAKVQVLKRGLFFPVRANKLFDLYRKYGSLDEISTETKEQIQKKYFQKSFDDVFEEVKEYYGVDSEAIKFITPKSRMAMIFKWYFGYATRNALQGNKERLVDFQVYCGPSMGAFNQFVKDTELADWRDRHVDSIGVLLMEEARKKLDNWFSKK